MQVVVKKIKITGCSAPNFASYSSTSVGIKDSSNPALNGTAAKPLTKRRAIHVPECCDFDKQPKHADYLLKKLSMGDACTRRPSVRGGMFKFPLQYFSFIALEIIG